MPTSYDSKSAIELFRNEKEYTWCEENLQGFFFTKAMVTRRSINIIRNNKLIRQPVIGYRHTMDCMG